MTRVYLAGGFYKGYKAEMRAMLPADQFFLFDPEAEGGPSYPGYYVTRDLDAIAASDLVIAYQDDYPYVYGMAAEMGFAAARSIPIIYICVAPRIDSFLSGLARATFSDPTVALKFVRDRYSAG